MCVHLGQSVERSVCVSGFVMMSESVSDCVRLCMCPCEYECMCVRVSMSVCG